MNADSPSAEIVVSSQLQTTPAKVWDRVITPEGIRDEMHPYLRMTLPAGVERLDPESVELGVKIGRSWILLFGLLPFDYDDITLVRLDPGRGFLERSQMLSQRVWEHERTIEPDAEGRLLNHRPGQLATALRLAGRAAETGDRLVLPSPSQAPAASLRRLGRQSASSWREVAARPRGLYGLATALT